jgi:hypothetical protein
MIGDKLRLNSHIIEKLRAKALKSPCRYKVAALLFNYEGNLIDSTSNKQRYFYNGGGLHAEALILRRNSKAAKTILIGRVNKKGKFLKIDPCPVCQKIANKLGVDIISIFSLR